MAKEALSFRAPVRMILTGPLHVSISVFYRNIIVAQNYKKVKEKSAAHKGVALYDVP